MMSWIGVYQVGGEGGLDALESVGICIVVRICHPGGYQYILHLCSNKMNMSAEGEMW